MTYDGNNTNKLNYNLINSYLLYCSNNKVFQLQLVVKNVLKNMKLSCVYDKENGIKSSRFIYKVCLLPFIIYPVLY